ncbi:Gfo/Idh/MocA family protein [Bacteriovorax sp. Seq25_V]|uniref:Gfo/Idh/MocA family protein n=1 Tax=Bacteriovorax sp. Seq25_V TaxID=1201288 RepID=UPI00038A286A|nr:Gfo/Idh/MocA family oxidoreductase [Bacteriovorax sp. Seq25_V]EQC47577.1 oxidoreductase, NAD-binding domain protein [Bacteriovorax sp. Seq25_V]
MTKVKVALIGYGHLGKWHAQKAQSLDSSELIAIVDPSEASRALAAEAFPGVKVLASLDEVINEIDAGLIVTPTSYHFAVAKQLIAAKKHVFCEKPVTSTLEQALELQKDSQGKNLVIQVGHSERCHQFWEQLPEFSFAHKEAKLCTIQRTSPFKGRAADVGVVEDLMIHDIDLMRMFFGDPKSVKAVGAKVITKNYDHVKAIFDYGDKIVTIENSRVDVKVERSVQFTSDKGILKVDLFNLKALFSKNMTADADQVVEEVSYERRDHLLVEQEKFYNSILNGTDIFVPLQDGIDAVTIIDAVNKSLATGNEVSL